MQLINFKGCQELTLSFGQHQTVISGANATGKTRIADAFSWCLFGKDSENKKDFNIKCLDSSGEPIHRQDTAVTIELLVDNMKKTFQRMYCEKWQKRRGDEQAEFTGHETLYYVDGVPLLQKEYMQAVDVILPEEQFKLTTNPFYFPSLNWDKRREILIKMAGVDEAAIYQSTEEFRQLTIAMEGRPLVSYLKMISERKKKIKADLLQIPPRISELQRGKPQILNYKAIKDEIHIHELGLQDFEKQLISRAARYDSRHKANIEKQNKISDLRSQLLKVENDSNFSEQKRVQDLENKISLARTAIRNNENLVTTNQQAIDVRERDLMLRRQDVEALRTEWTEADEKVFKPDPDSILCMTCHNPLTEAQQAQKHEIMQAAFNENKIKTLAIIEDTAAKTKKQISTIEAAVKELTAEMDQATAVIEGNKERIISLEADLAKKPAKKANAEAVAIKAQITELEAAIEEVKPQDNSEIKRQMNDLTSKIQALRLDLQTEEYIKKADLRISELQMQETDLAQQLSDLEKQEFIAERFEEVMTYQVEQAVNKCFALVKFRMFNVLINGGHEPACDILINGVPFPDANNAAKINAGIDIINALSSQFSCNAPIFVDNAEAVNDIHFTESQLIRLVVTTDKELIIKTY